MQQLINSVPLNGLTLITEYTHIRKNSTDTNNEYIVHYRVKADTSSDKPALQAVIKTMEVYTLKPGESPTITVSDRQSGSITVDTKAGGLFPDRNICYENSYYLVGWFNKKRMVLYTKVPRTVSILLQILNPETKYYIYAKRNGCRHVFDRYQRRYQRIPLLSRKTIIFGLCK